jgi:hypothetical protein
MVLPIGNKRERGLRKETEMFLLQIICSGPWLRHSLSFYSDGAFYFISMFALVGVPRVLAGLHSTHCCGDIMWV